jgi:molecular chaperone DnaK (HSP70)
VVVGIDFGTSRSGFAYAFVDDKKIVVNTIWPDQAVPYPKTASHILYSSEGKVAAWGNEARTQLASLRKKNEEGDYSYFYGFKMAMHSEPIAPAADLVIRDSRGKTFKLLDVIADYLRQLKVYLLNEINSATNGTLRSGELLWCLSIPAIWTDAEKHMMRVAAGMAGLIRAGEDERLLLVSEPEAAAVHCQEREKAQLLIGTRYMVIDCGGGTVDITAYEVVKDGLKELISGGGGAFGSTYIDKDFFQYLKTRITPEALELFHDTEPLDFIELMSTWERLKCNYDHRKNDQVMYFGIQAKLWKMLNREFPESLERLRTIQGGEDELIHLSRETILSLFTPTLDRLVESVREQFAKLDAQGCNIIFLVGGFSKSPLLQQRIADAFGARVDKIIIPPEPSAAILEGTVAFGLNPSVIRARRSRLTYGCGIEVVYDPKIDPVGKRVERADKNKVNCEDRFEVLVRAGEVVPVGHKLTRRYNPLANKQTNLKLPFYATRKMNPRYTDEEGVENIGMIEISLPDTREGVNRVVEVTLHFGETEIQISAKDMNTGGRRDAALRFSSTYMMT